MIVFLSKETTVNSIYFQHSEFWEKEMDKVCFSERVKGKEYNVFLRNGLKEKVSEHLRTSVMDLVSDASSHEKWSS